LGHFEELEKYFEFIQNILNNSGDHLQPLYSIAGEKDLCEMELDYLSGYLGNRPVRIGNKAYEQVQYDVYGQVLVGVMPLYTDRRLIFNRKSSYKKIVYWLLKQIERTRNLEDAGLWEFRNQKQIHTYTLLFHWAGAKAAYKIAKQFQDDVLMQQSERLALDAQAMLEKCYDQELKAYTQAMNTTHLDASTLMMITMNYLPHNSQKAKDQINALEKELLTDRALFYRYKHYDDFGVPESTFLVCAFWYADALACVGRCKDAIANLDNLLQYSNHLGIFSEDVSTDGSQWGNFPQTYSHVGLINAAFRIWKKMESEDFI
jgi:glucoamylase